MSKENFQEHKKEIHTIGYSPITMAPKYTGVNFLSRTIKKHTLKNIKKDKKTHISFISKSIANIILGIDGLVRSFIKPN